MPLKWNMNDAPDAPDRNWVGSKSPYAVAIDAVQRALGSYQLGGKLQLLGGRFSRTAGGESAHGMLEGTVVVEARLELPSAHIVQFNVPVAVRAGRVQDPAVIIHDSETKIIAQQTFDAICASATFFQKAPDRANLFSPPPDAPSRSEYRPIVRPGMFRLIGENMKNADHRDRMHKRMANIGAILEQADEARRQVFAQAMVAPVEDNACTDPCNMPPPEMGTGTCVRAARDIMVKGRGCIVQTISEGTEGCVIRDWDGTGAKFMVEFPFRTAIVDAADIEAL